MAEEENDYPSSLGYYAAVLEIFHEYKDEFNLKKAIGNLSHLLAQEGWDASAAIDGLEASEEIRKALRNMLGKVRRESSGSQKVRGQTARRSGKRGSEEEMNGCMTYGLNGAREFGIIV